MRGEQACLVFRQIFKQFQILDYETLISKSQPNICKEYVFIRTFVISRQACSPLIQLFFGFASDIDQTNINRDIRDGNWLSSLNTLVISLFWFILKLNSPKKDAAHSIPDSHEGES